MSTSRFPNADEQKVLALGQLVDDLLRNSVDAAKAVELAEFIVNAYVCAAIESMLVSSELKTLCPFDPKIVQDIKDKLKECT